MQTAAGLDLDWGLGLQHRLRLTVQLLAARPLTSHLTGGRSCATQEETELAFEETYCAAFELLDRHWLAMRATYMEFPIALR